MTITLSRNEEKEYKAVKLYHEVHRNLKRLAVELSRSVKTARRYITGFIAHGRDWFAHGNRGKISPHRVNDNTREKISSLFTGKYIGATYAHFTELIRENENLSYSETFIRSLLLKHFLLSPKSTRRTRRAVRAKLQALNQPPPVNLHPTRPRRRYFGELVQTDASTHPWFGEKYDKATLHIAVDDATSCIVGAYFDRQETLSGYYKMTGQMLTRYGIPASMLADNRTVFAYNKRDRDEETDRKTQFGYMCRNLGIELRTTSVAQAKGRVERMWDTLQNRLPIELRLAGITDIETANNFLPAYIDRLNAQFALPVTDSVFVAAPLELKLHLAVIAERKVDGGSVVRYNGKRYATVNADGERVNLPKGITGTAARTLDGELYFTVENKRDNGAVSYALTEIPEHELHSQNFDPPIENEKPPRKIYIPPENHPWRLSQFGKYRDKIARV